MNELDENMCDTYRNTNLEMLKLLRENQTQLFKCNIILLVVVIILSLSVILVSWFTYLNNKKWLEVFNSYEYSAEVIEYAQDGEGINNINQGIQGDVGNGTDAKNN